MPNLIGEPIGQDEKDRRHQQRLAGEQNATADAAGRPARAHWRPDTELDGLTRDELAAEAARRGVQVKAGARKPDLLAALRGEPANPEQDPNQDEEE